MHQKPTTIRIIGGQHRSRLITVLDSEGLRPTSARMRETLFNWLHNDLAGAHCLDLFAGSGALGIEALSRGAAQVTFIEKSAQSYQHLCHNISAIIHDSSRYQTHCTDALDFIESLSNSFDLIFIDPPFNAALYLTLMKALTTNPHLRTSGHIILETPRLNPVDDHKLAAYFIKHRSSSTKESLLTYYKNRQLVQ